MIPTLSGSVSRTMAAMSLGFIVMVTPWSIQEVVAACTGSKVNLYFVNVQIIMVSPNSKWHFQYSDLYLYFFTFSFSSHSCHLFSNFS